MMTEDNETGSLGIWFHFVSWNELIVTDHILRSSYDQNWKLSGDDEIEYRQRGRLPLVGVTGSHEGSLNCTVLCFVLTECNGKVGPYSQWNVCLLLQKVLSRILCGKKYWEASWQPGVVLVLWRGEPALGGIEAIPATKTLHGLAKSFPAFLFDG